MGEYTFVDHLTIHGAVDDVHQCLWSVEAWPELLPHVAFIHMLHEEPHHQRFRMGTKHEGGVNETESVRHSSRSDRIDYEQVVPPPLLASHRGCWRLKQRGDNVLVTAEHTIAINPERILPTLGREYTEQEAQLLARHFVGNHSMRTLGTIKSVVENTADASQAREHS